MERRDFPSRGAPKRLLRSWRQRPDDDPSPLCELEDHLIGADYYAEMGFLPPSGKSCEPEPVLAQQRDLRSA